MPKTPEEIKNDDLSLKGIIEQCMDAPGYVLFTAIIEPNKDPEKPNVIQYKFRRFHFSFEDTKHAIAAFKDFYRDELKKLEAEIDDPSGEKL